jgi:putative ABC transport system permease protein
VKLGDLVRLSGGALGGHRLRTVFSLLGVAIGVASVILLTSLGEGARLYVSDEFSSLGSNLLLILPGKVETTGGVPITGGVARDLTLEDAEALKRGVTQLRRVAPLSLGEAPASYKQKRRDIMVLGTTAQMLEIRQLTVLIGRFLPEGDVYRGQRVCVIGSTVQRELFGTANPLGEMIRIGEERFRVIGIMGPKGMSVGMDFDEVVYIPVYRAMRMFNRSGLFRIFAEVTRFEAIDSAKQASLALIKERHEDTEDVTVLTQDSILSTFNRILGALTAALGGIAAISLTVAGVGIMNVMLVSVSERIREIGLLKALGATRGQILAIFLTEASLLSFTGGLLGLGLGLAGAKGVATYWPDFPAQPPIWAVVGVLIVAGLVGLSFGALPARRAAALDPVTALAGR